MTDAAPPNNNDATGRFSRPPARRQVSSIDEPLHKTGIAGSTSNLVNSIVGSGIIGLPFALKESGIILGLFLLILVSYFTDKSLRLIVNLATFHPELKDIGVLTFDDLMSIPFGRLGSRFILISMSIVAYGAMVSYMIIVKDTVPTVLGLDDSFVERELIMIVVCSATMLPLSMMRDISQLAFTSSLSVTADIILLLVVAVHAPIQESVSNAGGLGQVIADHWINGHVFIGLGVLSTAMACQHSAFLISGTLENITAARWAQTTKYSLLLAGSLSTTFATVGYLGYLDTTQGDVLNNFDQNSPGVNAARSLLALTMIGTFPMEAFVLRLCLAQLLFNGNMDNAGVGPNGEMVPEQKFLGYFGRRETWTIYIFLMVLLPAVIFDDIGPVLSLTGSLGASAIAYVAPGLAYLGVHGDDFLQWIGGRSAFKGHDGSSDDFHGQVELPVMGDATAEMRTESALSTHAGSGPKPWWWFPTLMPIWVAIASSGGTSTRRFLADFHDGNAPLLGPTGDGDEVIGARKRDFVISIIFVVFGVVAATCGVISNIYVHVNDIFFSPH